MSEIETEPRFPKVATTEEPVSEPLVKKVGSTKRWCCGSGSGKASTHIVAEQAFGRGGGGVAGPGSGAHTVRRARASGRDNLISPGILFSLA
jgi:hypothetical protein